MSLSHHDLSFHVVYLELESQSCKVVKARYLFLLGHFAKP